MKLYAQRRQRLMNSIGDQGIVVVAAAEERIRNNDIVYPYRQDSNFWYLTGFHEPNAVLVLMPGRSSGQTLLFCQERDPQREVWDGPRVGPENAVAQFGMDDAYPMSDIAEILPGLLEGRAHIFYHHGRHLEFDHKMMAWVKRIREQLAWKSQPMHEFVDPARWLHEQRIIKSSEEVQFIQEAAQISVKAHRAAMLAAYPGVRECVLQADIERVFTANGACPAFSTIVGAGSNGCVLHYHANSAQCQAGDLVLVDAGAERLHYAADMSRTFPVSGRFTAPQRALHTLVDQAYEAALAQAYPGRPYAAMHDAAVATLTEGLLKLGLLRGDFEDQVVNGTYKRFYPHKTGHWVGIDVHDVGSYQVAGVSRQLASGMVLTIEPGLYIRENDCDVDARWRGIGIRIEDTILVTDSGPQVLTGALARSADAIEALMAQR